MGKIVVTTFVSLDGVMQDPGGAEDFKHGGWAMQTSMGTDGQAFKGDEAQALGAMLLGRRSYQEFAKVWPNFEEFAAYNAAPKYVVSNTLTPEQATWGPVTVLSGDDLPKQVGAIRSDVDGEIQVHGSGQLAQALVEHELVDELRLMVFPVILGAGQRLFGATSDKRGLRLTESRVVGDGVQILIYQLA